MRRQGRRGVHTNAVMQLNRVGLPRQWLLQIKKLLGECQGSPVSYPQEADLATAATSAYLFGSE